MAAEEKSAGTAIRQGALVILLIVFVIGFLYEYLNCRPANQQAIKDISALNQMSSSLPGKSPFTPTVMRRLVGFEPRVSEYKSDSNYLIEEYHWRRAVPTMSFFETVIYKRTGQNVLNENRDKEPTVDEFVFFRALSSNTKWQETDIPRSGFEALTQTIPESAMTEGPAAAGGRRPPDQGKAGGNKGGKGKKGKSSKKDKAKKRPEGDE